MNARTRDEIGYVACPECKGFGTMEHPDGLAACPECLGTRRVLAEEPRYAVQRHEGTRWHTLLRVAPGSFADALKHREQYEAERPGVYRIVQEIDEDYVRPVSKPRADLGTYAEQMRDAGRGHLLRGDE